MWFRTLGSVCELRNPTQAHAYGIRTCHSVDYECEMCALDPGTTDEAFAIIMRTRARWGRSACGNRIHIWICYNQKWWKCSPECWCCRIHTTWIMTINFRCTDGKRASNKYFTKYWMQFACESWFSITVRALLLSKSESRCIRTCANDRIVICYLHCKRMLRNIFAS